MIASSLNFTQLWSNVTVLESSRTHTESKVRGRVRRPVAECKALRMRNGRRNGRPFNSHECSRRSPTTLEGKVTCSLVHARIYPVRLNSDTRNVTPVCLYCALLRPAILYSHMSYISRRYYNFLYLTMLITVTNC